MGIDLVTQDDLGSELETQDMRTTMRLDLIMAVTIAIVTVLIIMI